MLVNDDFNPNMVVDFSKIFIMGHSSGAHVIVNYLKVNYLYFDRGSYLHFFGNEPIFVNNAANVAQFNGSHCQSDTD
jgi:hypothetical protein